MKRILLLALPAAMLLAGACAKTVPTVVESIDAFTEVGDTGILVDAIEITVDDARSIKRLKSSDFDIINNVPDGQVDRETGGPLREYADDGIVLSRRGRTLRIEASPFSINGMRGENYRRMPWKLVCSADTVLNVDLQRVTARHTAILDDCIQGSFTYAGITREYMLYLPKDRKGETLKNVPLMVWQIGGGEYNRDLWTAATANRCLVSLPAEGIPCATLVFAIANPNYTYSASLYPERIELVDRNNALQMAFIDTLIADGTVDGSRVFCAGASSGGGCTMRFAMQFPDRFKAAIPCCAMDPIVPIHRVEEKYEGQFADDLEKAFQGEVYKWNGSEMALAPMDTEAFVKLPMFFVHAASDRTCKVASSYAYFEARKRLGATADRISIFDDAYMQSYGISPMITHFSWVPLLDDFSEGTAMDWLVSQL
ncbi:MAG: prolyl oligopeptidase family serine peptidase [Bacteroidales bacterium]|nr:prolyl oligopeptidase family serine peptidase [Bacteroidales bacterium]